MRNKTKTAKEFEKSLFKLLESKNYHDITINEICALTNKTKMTFYHYYNDKEDLLAIASINLINTEYDEEYNKILSKVTDVEEIEYQSLIATYELIAKHYHQITNLIYNGETLPLEIFKRALFNNYSKYISVLLNSSVFDIPSDYISIFCFEGLFETCLYYSEQLKNNKSKRKAKEDMKKVCRVLAKAVIAIAKN
ncbi:MAG: TetR/AcrR family transcriptional regulator [Bacilli bacterium]|nr:TetR/AcrR family transcriptional regulator [Bacilli bacterium]